MLHSPSTVGTVLQDDENVSSRNGVMDFVVADHAHSLSSQLPAHRARSV